MKTASKPTSKSGMVHAGSINLAGQRSSSATSCVMSPAIALPQSGKSSRKAR